ncbi:apolipoprotein N-acyltransferase [Galbitalea sp. SE-J8]|uniref:apolipoprotein N-acyltransferase n=1 Tax=Galbitalea sp. SE-J8 TaxID=3054952 RepID=UPI00259D24B6|nr:apolipoprotein N-acyltransferase [Galbitalea sp. SE-J8]MDM4764010.1 apolipoprotein N-acyltransferase [Galbitalea sp. SE-J8]
MLRPVLPLWCALALAIGAGPVLDAAFPEIGFWPAILPGIAMVLVALVGRRAGAAFLVGLVAGTSFYLVDIPWIQQFLGDSFGALSLVPLLGLSIFEGLFWGVGAILVALAYRWVPRLGVHRALLPVVVAGLWTLREWVTSTWPFGGFSWGRVGFTQAEGPLAPLLSWIGTAGVTFLIVLAVAAAIEAARARSLGGGAVLAASVIAALLVPSFPVTIDGTMRVAAVQGDGRAGYFDRAAYGELLEAQTEATYPVLDDPGLDVVVWPEGGTDVDPETRAEAARIFDAISRRTGAPLVSGVITTRGDLTYNTSIVWQAGRGITDYYDKRHPVPFGEYVPLRSLIEPLVPDLIGLIGRDYTPGSTDPVARIGDVVVGLNICFDIVDDALLRETVDDGAQIVFAQSNNADFGRTDESVQQLAIARVRALETGRSIVVVSTVGQSAIIRPDGTTMDSVPRYTPAAMVDDVPLSTTRTAAVVTGAGVEELVSLFGLAVVVGAGVIAGFETRRSLRSRRSSTS